MDILQSLKIEDLKGWHDYLFRRESHPDDEFTARSGEYIRLMCKNIPVEIYGPIPERKRMVWSVRAM